MRWRLCLLGLLAAGAAAGAMPPLPQETEEPPLALTLPPGTHRFELKLSDESLEPVAGAVFALPGSRVDVLVTTPQAGRKAVTRFVLENVLVVAVEVPEAKPGRATPPTTVMLAVTPEQGKTLARAAARGTLFVILHAPKSEKAPGSVTIDEILGGPAEKKTPRDQQPAPAAAGEVVPPGHRAVGIKVPAAVARALRPGMRVDVTAVPSKAKDDSGTRVLAENVLVLATDGCMLGEDLSQWRDCAVLTLALTPETALRMAFSVDRDRYSLRVVPRPGQKTK